jgi:ABC-2 type transport system ATP-binding protein
MELVIENLSKTYPNGVKALNNLSLRVPTGMFGLLGPNGAGKSSLMRTIATLQSADTGTVKLGDIDVLKDKDAVRKLLGYLPQDFGTYPNMSAEDLLDHIAVLKGINNKKARHEIVKTLLQQTNLYEARKKNLGGYSGGMKQRFGIAQALLGNPKLIIVDEPTAGLDPAERNRFLNLLSEIGENVIVILSTHIVEDVKELCTRMAIINKGTVLLEDHPVAALEKIAGQIWRKFINKGELEQYQNSYTVISHRLITGRMEIHVYALAAPDSTFSPAEADLEDVYFLALNRELKPATAVA